MSQVSGIVFVIVSVIVFVFVFVFVIVFLASQDALEVMRVTY